MHMSLLLNFLWMMESRHGIVLIWLLYFIIQIRFPWLICRDSQGACLAEGGCNIAQRLVIRMYSNSAAWPSGPW